ncbi:MAG: hypothetical protein PHT78_11550 [Desulfitobacteriaceae bacterium]|nr:hypothetical protein [Desulfitobacteriaceae bacterium]
MDKYQVLKLDVYNEMVQEYTEKEKKLQTELDVLTKQIVRLDLECSLELYVFGNPDVKKFREFEAERGKEKTEIYERQKEIKQELSSVLSRLEILKYRKNSLIR